METTPYKPRRPGVEEPSQIPRPFAIGDISGTVHSAAQVALTKNSRKDDDSTNDPQLADLDEETTDHTYDPNFRDESLPGHIREQLEVLIKEASIPAPESSRRITGKTQSYLAQMVGLLDEYGLPRTEIYKRVGISLANAAVALGNNEIISDEETEALDALLQELDENREINVENAHGRRLQESDQKLIVAALRLSRRRKKAGEIGELRKKYKLSPVTTRKWEEGFLNQPTRALAPHLFPKPDVNEEEVPTSETAPGTIEPTTSFEDHFSRSIKPAVELEYGDDPQPVASDELTKQVQPEAHPEVTIANAAAITRDGIRAVLLRQMDRSSKMLERLPLDHGERPHWMRVMNDTIEMLQQLGVTDAVTPSTTQEGIIQPTKPVSPEVLQPKNTPTPDMEPSIVYRTASGGTVSIGGTQRGVFLILEGDQNSQPSHDRRSTRPATQT